jgi:hypothetical protein
MSRRPGGGYARGLWPPMCRRRRFRWRHSDAADHWHDLRSLSKRSLNHALNTSISAPAMSTRGGHRRLSIDIIDSPRLTGFSGGPPMRGDGSNWMERSPSGTGISGRPLMPLRRNALGRPSRQDRATRRRVNHPSFTHPEAPRRIAIIGARCKAGKTKQGMRSCPASSWSMPLAWACETLSVRGRRGRPDIGQRYFQKKTA